MSSPTERLNIALADRYRIERRLGTGGMATVYLAYGPRWPLHEIARGTSLDFQGSESLKPFMRFMDSDRLIP